MTDAQIALEQLPAELQEDVQLTALVAQCLGVAPGEALNAAAVLVAAHRTRQAG